MKMSMETRRNVYRRIKERYMSGWGHGLCYMLFYLTNEQTESVKIEDYPELVERKPKEIRDDGFWWPVEDKESRINVLEEAIKFTY